MGSYWHKVFARAWADTKQSFGWNQKTAATALVALVGIGVAFFQFGIIAMIASATGLFWTGLPFVGAGLLLFVWNFFSAVPSLYTELSKSSGEKIAALEMTLAKLQQPPPDYEAWRHVDRLSLLQAACLWCDLSPARSIPTSNVRAWYEALAAAVRKGELNFEPAYSGFGPRDLERDLEKRQPTLNTMVTRKALQAFAKMHGHDPEFLRDA